MERDQRKIELIHKLQNVGATDEYADFAHLLAAALANPAEFSNELEVHRGEPEYIYASKAAAILGVEFTIQSAREELRKYHLDE